MKRTSFLAASALALTTAFSATTASATCYYGCDDGASSAIIDGFVVGDGMNLGLAIGDETQGASLTTKDLSIDGGIKLREPGDPRANLTIDGTMTTMGEQLALSGGHGPNMTFTAEHGQLSLTMGGIVAVDR